MATMHPERGSSIIPLLIVVILLVLGAAYMVAYREGISEDSLPFDEFLASTPYATSTAQ